MSLPHPVLPKTSTTCTSSENRARKYTVNPSLSVTVNSNKNELESTPPSTLGAVKVAIGVFYSSNAMGGDSSSESSIPHA